MKTILWVSRHTPLESQLKELRRLYGEDCKIDIQTHYTFSADWVVKYYRKIQAVDMVIVAPLSVIQEVVKLGVFPLHAAMEKIPNGDPRTEIVPKNARDRLSGEKRSYRFIKFKRYKKFNIELEDV